MSGSPVNAPATSGDVNMYEEDPLDANNGQGPSANPGNATGDAGPGQGVTTADQDKGKGKASGTDEASMSFSGFPPCVKPGDTVT